MDRVDDDLAALDRGVERINRLLGLTLPRPTGREPIAPAAPDLSEAGTEARFAALMHSQFDGGDGPEFDHARGALKACFPWVLPDEAIASRVEQCLALDHQDLVETVFGSITIQPIGLDEVFRQGGHVYTKLNHGFWEKIAFRGCQSLGAPYVRPMKAALDPMGMFGDLVALALAAQRRRRGAVAGCYLGDRFAVGLGFNDGMRESSRQTYSGELWQAPRGAMTGCLAFLDAAAPSDRHLFADAGFPKRLVMSADMPVMAERIADGADALVFVVPPHLARIRLKGFAGDDYRLIVPPRSIHALWPVVLAVVLGRLAEIMRTHRRVTVLVQAASLAVPMGSLLDLMRDEAPDGELHVIDMGQALDVATLATRPRGPWARRQDPAGHDSPLYLQR